MKNSMYPNVRLVRCPRCREVLPEPADVLFYKCGGCDTILQAKHYNKANERRNSESSDSVQNNAVEYSVQGGQASSSSSSLVTDPNEGTNQSNAEHGNCDQSGASNSSREASLSEPKQQPPSSSAQHFLERNQETEQNFEVTNFLKEDSSLNESCSPGHEVPSTLVPETGEIKGQIEQCGNRIASSSNESVEQLVLENQEVRQIEIAAEDQLESAHSHIETASSEATTAITDGEVDELNQNVSLNYRMEQPGIAPVLSEVLLSSQPSRHEMDYSSQLTVEDGQVEESSSKTREQLEVSDSSPVLSNELRVGGDGLSAQLGSPDEEVMTMEEGFVSNPRERQPVSEVSRELEAPSGNEPVSSSQFLTENKGQVDNMVEIYSRDADVYSNTEDSSNKSAFCENEVLSQLKPGMDERSIQNDLGASNESTVVLPEALKTSCSILNFKSVEVDDSPTDENNSVPALKTTKEAALLGLLDRSQKTLETNLTENVKAEKITEPIEVVDAHFEAGISYRDLPKCPTRGSAYDGSVSSYDGHDNQVKTEKFAAEEVRQYRPGRSRNFSGSTFRRKFDNLQATTEERNPPVMLTEIKMPEALSDAPYRRKGTRPWSQEFPPRAPMYRSPERRRYGSSDHLVHKDYYKQPIYHPPCQYRDVESRFTRQSDSDGRMISEAVWMGEEFLAYPYPESSSETYPYPRGEMHYHGTRRSAYQPPVHNTGRVAYSGETVRSRGYMRWPSHLPPPDVSYGRSLYGPREPFGSNAASPQVFSDSDYYSEDQSHSAQRTRRNSQHLQPIGGAAPFITCYHCLELLQLPSDFLVLKGMKVERVKCSACSKVLKFTLEKGRHLVRHMPKQPGAVKSASTSQAYHDNEGSNRHFQDKGKGVMEEMQRHDSNKKDSSAPDMPRNARVTWKLADRRSTSPLHRLMGYPSPSAVLYGYGSDDLETDDDPAY